jgi:hypothetical protein
MLIGIGGDAREWRAARYSTRPLSTTEQPASGVAGTLAVAQSG